MTALEISEEVLGIGSYGKVCKAKYGQLPCAAKLLHDTLFQHSDPGVQDLTRRFEQECQFLSTIKHPNIVQYLGTSRDLRSQRPVLLMELMDENLTRFLEHSIGPLPYHTQLNICHDVALALAYLHSNDIIHRDLSSNNVLLIGEGSRAKVTDFGMSKLVGMNPRMTQLTMCPGTAVYMPPEALTTPPHYSSKLDCFSHGVLTIQVLTKQFPNPKDATSTIEDTRYPTGRIVVFIPESDRRKEDIDCVEPEHPLLPLALQCLRDRDTERPSARDLCIQLTSLKREPSYTESAQSRLTEIQRLQLGLQNCRLELQTKTQEYATDLQSKEQTIREARSLVAMKDARLSREREEYRSLLDKKEEVIDEMHAALQNKEATLTRKQHNYQTELKAKEKMLDEYHTEMQRKRAVLEQERKEHQLEIEAKEKQIASYRAEMYKIREQNRKELEHKDRIIEQLHRDFSHRLRSEEEHRRELEWNLHLARRQLDQEHSIRRRLHSELNLAQAKNNSSDMPDLLLKGEQSELVHSPQDTPMLLKKKAKPEEATETPCDSHTLSFIWTTGEPAPDTVRSLSGTVVVHGTTVYFSKDFNVYAYKLHENKWRQLEQCPYQQFSMAVINDKLISIGGSKNNWLKMIDTPTKSLLTYTKGWLSMKWDKVLPPMLTERILPTAITIDSHLLVAGGRTSLDESSSLSTMEAMSIQNLQWCKIGTLPKVVHYPQLSLCCNGLFLSDENSVFSCHIEDVLKPATGKKDDSAVPWSRCAKIPSQKGPSLVSFGNHLLAVGGEDEDQKQSGKMYSYDGDNDKWSVVGEMITPRSYVLIAALPSKELLVVGGCKKSFMKTCEIANINLDTCL